jgi:hypothetical protein
VVAAASAAVTAVRSGVGSGLVRRVNRGGHGRVGGGLDGCLRCGVGGGAGGGVCGGPVRGSRRRVRGPSRLRCLGRADALGQLALGDPLEALTQGPVGHPWVQHGAQAAGAGQPREGSLRGVDRAGSPGDRVQPGPGVSEAGGVGDPPPQGRDEPENRAPVRTDRPRGGQPGQVGVYDPCPRVADPRLGPGRPPGPGQAGQGRVQLLVAGRPAVQYHDPVAGDPGPSARGQPDQFRAPQPVAEPAVGRDRPLVRMDGEQDQVLAEGVHRPTLTRKPAAASPP